MRAVRVRRINQAFLNMAVGMTKVAQQQGRGETPDVSGVIKQAAKDYRKDYNNHQGAAGRDRGTVTPVTKVLAELDRKERRQQNRRNRKAKLRAMGRSQSGAPTAVALPLFEEPT